MEEEKIILPKTISEDVIFDIFMFIDRNETEKCQLICANWKELKLKHDNILPMRTSQWIDVTNVYEEKGK